MGPRPVVPPLCRLFAGPDPRWGETAVLKHAQTGEEIAWVEIMIQSDSPGQMLAFPALIIKLFAFLRVSLLTVHTTKARRARAEWRLLLPGEWGTCDSWNHGQSGRGAPRCRRKVVLFFGLPQLLLFLTRHAAYSSGQGPVRKHTPHELRKGTVRKCIISTNVMVNFMCPFGRATGAGEFVKRYSGCFWEGIFGRDQHEISRL